MMAKFVSDMTGLEAERGERKAVRQSPRDLLRQDQARSPLVKVEAGQHHVLLEHLCNCCRALNSKVGVYQW